MIAEDLVKFTNCYIVKNNQLIKDDLWVKSGYFINPELYFYKIKCLPKTVHDMGGCILAPGFIDIQINGGFGIDFSHNLLNNLEGNLDEISKRLPEHGVTAFCPTLVSSHPDIYHEIIPLMKRRKGGKRGAEILGIHLEGPFINMEKKGAHYEENVKGFDQGIRSLVDVYGNLNNVSIVTLAPELNRAMEVIDYLVSKNIKVSMGHSNADFEKGMEGVDHGSTLLTHLFNAMNPFHHREPGLVGVFSVENQKVFYSLIADGKHLHPVTIKMAFKANPTRIILVTDAMSAMENHKGVNTIGDQIVEVRDNAAYIAGSNTLAGSVTNMIQCVKCLKESAGCSVSEALEAASLHPAQFLGIEKTKGTFEFGADADFVCLDSDLNVQSTWIAGECFYKIDK